MPENGYRDLGPIVRRDEVGDIVLDYEGNRYVVEAVGMRYISVIKEGERNKQLLRLNERIQTNEKVKT